MIGFEFAILDFIKEHLRTSFGDFIMPIISMLGNGGIIWLCIAGVLCIFPKYRKYGITMLIAILIDVLICNVTLKPLIARMRPFTVNTDISLLIDAPKDYSFPSGHTACSFAGTFSLLFSKCRLWKPSMILAVLIAFSRLYLYVHYPTDVFAGILIGFISGFIACIIYRTSEKTIY